MTAKPSDTPEAAWADLAKALYDSGDCASCGEGDPLNECPKSQRPCGHHCNHIWEVDACDWCGYESKGDEDD